MLADRDGASLSSQTNTTSYPYRARSAVSLPVPVERVFAHLDDHSRLSAHMAQRSWRMGWGKMHLVLDEARGQAPGSRIRLAGRVFGIRLTLEEIVTERVPPVRKVWTTLGAPRLLVIGPYRMGFQLESPGPTALTLLTVFIEYALPPGGVPLLLGRLFGHAYARWCTARMTTDARKHLASDRSSSPTAASPTG